MNAQVDVSPLEISRKQRKPVGDRLAITVADRLKRLVARRGGSVERLAEVAGIEPEELSRIEAGIEAPTIGHLWRIANALGVPFGSLVASKERQGVFVIRKNQAQRISSSGGAFFSRALYPYDSQRPVEFYHVVIGPSHLERAEAHAPSTKENIVVAQGSIEVIVGREPPVQLDEGDAIDFLADVPHSYRNLGAMPAVLYLVMSYISPEA
jgi:transcriptional regulator with XRE-family HTH domain